MTIEEKMKEMLSSRGLHPDQAQQIIEIAKKDIKSMKYRWSEMLDAYPSQFLDVLWPNIKSCALTWIDENVPKAWYRELFV